MNSIKEDSVYRCAKDKGPLTWMFSSVISVVILVHISVNFPDQVLSEQRALVKELPVEYQQVFVFLKS